MAGQVANEDQITYWNEQAGPKWVRMQADVDLQIGPIWETLLARIGPKPGQRILDVGCGCGTTTMDLARAVAPTPVVGLDISEPMLVYAQERAAKAGIDNVEFVNGDAQVYAFNHDAFDLAVSRFGVMFFEDPTAAFANVRRVLAPDGRLHFVCWQPLSENPWMAVPLFAAAEYVELPPPPQPGEPGPFSLGDPDWIREILSGAGYANVEIDSDVRELPLGGGRPLDETADFILRIGPLNKAFDEADEEGRKKIQAAVKGALEPYWRNSAVQMKFSTWMVTARNG